MRDKFTDEGAPLSMRSWTKPNQDMPFKRWLSELPSLLIQVDRPKRISFLAATCERQFGNYLRFYQETGWGHPPTLYDGLQALWNYSGSIDNHRLRTLERRIKEVTPDTEKFSSAYTSAALDAASVILESFNYCLDDNTEHCVQVARLCRDTVYMFVEQRDGDTYADADELKIYSDPLVERELRAQQSDFEMIRSLPDDSSIGIPVEKRRCPPDCGTLEISNL
ncbi:DUF416 family protein [Edaphobacter sp. HDX4]|uniref:DUF416 family protein n=1 Tax=Edaphobacter sp. HDX4 TaxID=2794064 RepID=UPI002FE5512A